jgi:hypothetical protein
MARSAHAHPRKYATWADSAHVRRLEMSLANRARTSRSHPTERAGKSSLHLTNYSGVNLHYGLVTERPPASRRALAHAVRWASSLAFASNSPE